MDVFLIVKSLVFGGVLTVLCAYTAYSSQLKFEDSGHVRTYILQKDGKIVDENGDEVEYVPVDQGPDIVAAYTDKLINSAKDEDTGSDSE
jgi:hypothetical protein